MHFSFGTITGVIILLIFAFILTRFFGKYLGVKIRTTLLKMSPNVKKYAFEELIPQGGIVLGLSLIITQNHYFKDFSNLLVGIIMGAAIIHEFIGPFVLKLVLEKAEELKKIKKNKEKLK